MKFIFLWGRLTLKLLANHGSICRLFNHRCDDEKGPMLKWQYVHTLMQDQRMPTIAFFAQVRFRLEKFSNQNVSFSSIYIWCFSVISKKAKKSLGTIDYKQLIRKLLSAICVIVNRQNVENTSLSTLLRKNLSETKTPIVSYAALQQLPKTVPVIYFIYWC